MRIRFLSVDSRLLVAILLLAACTGNGCQSNNTGPVASTPAADGGQFVVSTEAGPGGHLAPTSRRVNQGRQGRFSVIVEAGYIVGPVHGCGGSLDGEVFTTAPIEADCTVSATFYEQGTVTYQVSTQAGSGGSVSPRTATVASGEQVTLQLKADAGFAVDTVSGCGGTLTGSSFTTGAISGDCTVTASFRALAVTTGDGDTPVATGDGDASTTGDGDVVTTGDGDAMNPPVGDGMFTVNARASQGGKIGPASLTVQAGATGTFTVEVDAGFVLDSVMGCAGKLSGTTFTTGPIKRDCAVTANFRPAMAAQGDMQVTRTPLQTMIGLEANAAMTEDEGECSLAAIRKYHREVARQAVEVFGLDRVRLEVRSGAENDTDYFTQALNGVITFDAYQDIFYTPKNDNNDPNTVAPNRFWFSELDLKIELVVNPLREELAARGRDLYVALNYVNFGDPSVLHNNAPAEYAEFMAVAIKHIESKYGWVPDGVEVLLEPDLRPQWSPTQFGNNLKALRERLMADGYDLEYIGPSTTDMSKAAMYFDAAVSIAGDDALDEISYHKYRGVNDPAYTAIRDRMTKYGVRSGMLENFPENEIGFERDLTQAMASTWTQLGLSACGTPNGGDYFYVDDSDPNNAVVHVTENSKYIAHYSRTVHRGAVRYDVNSNRRSSFAFQNPDGTWTAVIHTSTPLTIGGLPSGTYRVFVSSASGSAYLQDLPDITTGANGLLQVPVSENSFITVHQRF